MQVELILELCEKLDATLLRSLGAGAFKHVYLINRDGRDVALKVAPVSGDLRARFEREIEALKQCSHPAIASIFTSDSVILRGQEYWVITEEYLPGGTLAELRASIPLSSDDVRKVGCILVGAIAHLCDRSFVHRDIKPANILFRKNLEPVLTDFGLVRMLDQCSLTQDFMVQGPGTPLYAAPEQLLNEKSSIDWRTDQFGLALVLAEQLLGHHAFLPDSSGNLRDAILAVSTRKPLPESSRQRLESEGFGCLIKALSPWPINRFRRPDQFLFNLQGKS